MKLGGKKYAKHGMTFLVSIVLSALYSMVASSIVEVPFLSIFTISTISFYLLIDNLKYLGGKKYRSIYITVTMLQLVLLIYNAKTKSVFLTGVDWGNFDRLARAALENSSGIVEIYNNSQDLFVFFVAAIYSFFGPYVNQIFFYIFPLSLLLFRFVYKTVLLLSNNKIAAMCAGLAIIIWPVNFVFSISLLREIPIQILVISSFYNFVKYIKAKKVKNLIYAFILASLATLMHSGMMGILIIYLYIWLQDRTSKDYKFVKISALAISCTLMAAISFTPLWEDITRQFTGIDSVQKLTQSLEIRSEALIANTNYITDVPQSLSEIITSTPYRITMFSFSPFIWQVFSVGTLIAFLIDGILQIGLALMIFKIFRRIKTFHYEDKNIITIITMCILITYAMFSFGTNNYGTAMRHRSKVLPLSITLVSAYYFNSKGRKKVLKPSRDRLASSIKGINHETI